MGWDRCITWGGGETTAPTISELRLILEDYLGDLGSIDNLGQDSSLYAGFLVAPKTESLGSFPFHRIESLEEDFRKAQQRHLQSRSRWFEVHRDENSVVITTRQQDEFTNTVASGFAKLIARYWHGELDLGG